MPVPFTRQRRRLLTALVLATSLLVPASAVAATYPTYPTTPTPPPTAKAVIGAASFTAKYPGGAPVPLAVQTNGDQVYLNAPKTAVADASANGCISISVKVPLTIPTAGYPYSYAGISIGGTWAPLYPVGGGLYSTPDWWPVCLYSPQSGPMTIEYSSYSGYPNYFYDSHSIPLGQFTLIDPAGTAYDQVLYDSAIAHGADARSARAYAAVGGASVELQAKGRDGVFRAVSELDPALAPAVNPETTPTYGGARGQYAWKSTTGVTYRAVVTAPGYDEGTSAAVEADPVLTGMHVALHAVCPAGQTPDYGGVADYPTGTNYPTYPTWDYPTYPGSNEYPVYVGYPGYPGYPLEYPGSPKAPFSCHGPCPAGQVGAPPNCHVVVAPPGPADTPTPTQTETPTPEPQNPQSGTGTTPPRPTPTPKATPAPTPKVIQVAFKGKLKVDKTKHVVSFTCSTPTGLSGAQCKVTVVLGKKKSGPRLFKTAAKLTGASKTLSLKFGKKAWAQAVKKGKITITLTLVGPTGATISVVTKTISVP